jgi:hypothetical protein
MAQGKREVNSTDMVSDSGPAFRCAGVCLTRSQLIEPPVFFPTLVIVIAKVPASTFRHNTAENSSLTARWRAKPFYFWHISARFAKALDGQIVCGSERNG